MRIDKAKLRPGQVVEAEPLAAFAECSVGALLRSRAERFGDKDALRFRTRSGRWQELSFRQLDWFRRLSAAALAELGVSRGDRVLVVSQNGVAVYVAELALLTLGEGWHNNHHHFMASARQGFFWWEIDVTYYTLKVMSWLGIVWDLRKVPAHLLTQQTIAA